MTSLLLAISLFPALDSGPSVCAMTGNPISDDVSRVDYAGVQFGFCGVNCVIAFERNPATVLRNLPSGDKPRGMYLFDPVSGARIDLHRQGEVKFKDLGGVRVYFESSANLKTYEANDKAYRITAPRECLVDAVTRTPLATYSDAVGFVNFGGVRYYFSDADTMSRFKATPTASRRPRGAISRPSVASSPNRDPSASRVDPASLLAPASGWGKEVGPTQSGSTDFMNVAHVPLSFDVFDAGVMGYQPCWDLQKQLAAEVAADARPETLVLVEHPAVLTLGANFHSENLLHPEEWYAERGIDIVVTDRGGDVTYHGPGQLVIYPVFRVDRHGRDLHRWLRDLEETMLRTLAAFGLEGRRFPPHTGVWIGEKKVAAIGIKVRKWVNLHGIALNCENTLDIYDEFVPCGIRDYGVTSLSKALGRVFSVAEAKSPVLRSFQAVFFAQQ